MSGNKGRTCPGDGRAMAEPRLPPAFPAPFLNGSMSPEPSPRTACTSRRDGETHQLVSRFRGSTSFYLGTSTPVQGVADRGVQPGTRNELGGGRGDGNEPVRNGVLSVFQKRGILCGFARFLMLSCCSGERDGDRTGVGRRGWSRPGRFFFLSAFSAEAFRMLGTRAGRRDGCAGGRFRRTSRQPDYAAFASQDIDLHVFPPAVLGIIKATSRSLVPLRPRRAGWRRVSARHRTFSATGPHVSAQIVQSCPFQLSSMEERQWHNRTHPESRCRGRVCRTGCFPCGTHSWPRFYRLT